MYHHLLLSIIFLLSPPLTSSKSPNVTQDFGRIIFTSPRSVLEPKTSQDITHLLSSVSSSPAQNNITVAARGSGHSSYGQGGTTGGIVVDMLSLPNSIRVVPAAAGGDVSYVDAGGGALWVDVLNESLKHGLTPRSWTDYLYLTVGGTLSVGGISGQTFKFGPQIANVLELDVITGKGELLTCSPAVNSDLFYGVLGGLGQFGIITRARIILKPALRMARWISVPYDNFDQLTRGQELVITAGEVDYLEGFINLEGPSGSNLNYSLETVIYYDDEGTAQKVMDRVLSQLKVERSAVQITNMSYFDFLNRVRAVEEELGKKGLWDVPHPWLNLFVPRAQIGRFKDLLIETISDNYSGGPIILYPTFTQKWNPQLSAMVPKVDDSGIMYAVSILRSAPANCTSGTPCLNTFLQQNQKLISISTGAGGMGAKQYIPYLHDQMEWKAHFGEKWERFTGLKSKFDPLHILAPGQRIFERKAIRYVTNMAAEELTNIRVIKIHES